MDGTQNKKCQQDKKGILRNQGKSCKYCYVTARSNYMPKYDLKGLAKMLGAPGSVEESEKIFDLRKHAIKTIQEADDPDATVKWTEMKKELVPVQ